MSISIKPHATSGRTWLRWLGLAIVVGIVAGIAAILFQMLVETGYHFLVARTTGIDSGHVAGEARLFEFKPDGIRIWLLVPIMTLGGLFTGWLVYTFAPEAEGHGTDGVIDAFHNRRGFINIKVPIVKMIASAITLGTGGSAGKEGPIAQIAAGFGSFLAQKLKLSIQDQRMLLAVGMGAGVGAIFRAPMAGAIFAGEILYRDADIESNVIMPAAIASTVAYSVFQLSLPAHMRFVPLFGDSLDLEVESLVELIPFTILALGLVAAAIVYVSTFNFTHRFFSRLPMPRKLKPALGAFLTSLVVIAAYFLCRDCEEIFAPMASGYGLLQSILTSTAPYTILFLLLIALAKILTTSLTIGSGGSGGVFGPSMVIGGAVGAGIGKACQMYLPALAANPSAFAIVGMAGFFAACANAPFSTILIVSEMTGDYKLLLPTMWVSTICFMFCRRWSIYSKQVHSQLDSPAHLGDYTFDLLAGIKVEDLYRKQTDKMTFHEHDSLETIVHALAETNQRYFHVFNSDEEFVGIFSAEDVRRYLYDDNIWRMVNASDIMNENVQTVTPDDEIMDALAIFAKLNIDEIPVVDSSNPNRVLGKLRRKETIAYYNRKRLEFQKHKEMQDQRDQMGE